MHKEACGSGKTKCLQSGSAVLWMMGSGIMDESPYVCKKVLQELLPSFARMLGELGLASVPQLVSRGRHTRAYSPTCGALAGWLPRLAARPALLARHHTLNLGDDIIGADEHYQVSHMQAHLLHSRASCITVC